MIVFSSAWGISGKLSLIGLIFLVLSTGNLQAQDEFCAAFKEGSFYIPPTDKLPVSYKVERNGETQIETVKSSPKGLLTEETEDTQYAVVKWLDNCSYRLWYDESRGPLSAVQQMINRNNGILVELLSVDGNCVNFRSTLVKPEEIVTILGQQCKD